MPKTRGMVIIASLALISSSLLVQQIYSQEEDSVFKFYGRGHVDPSDPIFGDEFIRTIIKGDKGAIIDVISHYGIVVIRMDLERDLNCHPNNSIVCFNGKVSKLRNVDHPNVGSEISIKLNLQEGTEEISLHTGNMNGTNVLIYLENIGDSKHHPDKGNLEINWQSCEVEFNKKSGLPEIVKIIPQVVDDVKKPLTYAVETKFRFSFDNIISESSHAHFGYSIIEDFKIQPENQEPIILNLTDAILKAEDTNISAIQIESRHYTILPPSKTDPVSYNNEDQIVLGFSLENEGWIEKPGLCKSISVK